MYQICCAEYFGTTYCLLVLWLKEWLSFSGITTPAYCDCIFRRNWVTIWSWSPIYYCVEYANEYI